MVTEPNTIHKRIVVLSNTAMNLKLLSSVFQSGNLQDLDEWDILDPKFQQRLEDARTLVRQEIQRELKIKEAAERLRRAVTSRKNAADVEGQLKASTRKLEKLHWELQELNARSMTTEKDGTTGGISTRVFFSSVKMITPPTRVTFSYSDPRDLSL